MRTRVNPSIYCAVVVVASALLGAGSANAETYIINTGGYTSAQIAQYAEAAGITSYIASAPNTSLTINGAVVRYAGEANNGNKAVYTVAGNFNLGATDSIYVVGDRLFSLVVGNNATFAQGSRIDASAVGRLAGAGGGNGGSGAYGGLEVLTANGIDVRSSRPGGRGNSGWIGYVPPDEDTGATRRAFSGEDGWIYYNDAIASPTGELVFSWYYVHSFAGENGSAGRNNTAAAGVGGAGQESDLVMAKGGAAGTPGISGRNGVHGFTPATPGSNGGTGGRGEDGKDGMAGNAGTNATSFELTGSGSRLFGGAGGGGGASGSDGLAGGGGGAGGHGGKGGTTSGSFNQGGAGGSGADGAYGGRGTSGTNGGGGGGGIEIVVRGKLSLSSQLHANGGDAGAVQAPEAGQRNTEVTPGPRQGGMGESTHFIEPVGGGGGNGGYGGHGGNGAAGGSGGGGSGGSIFVSASVINMGPSVFSTVGGAGSSGFGASGLVGMHFNAGNASSEGFTDEIAGRTNPYRSYRYEFNARADSTPMMPGLIGGADIAGVVGDGSGNALGGIANAIAAGSAPTNAAAVVWRANADGSQAFLPDAFNGHDLLGYSTFNASVNAPAIAATHQSANPFFAETYVPDGPQALTYGGFVNDPLFNPDATGPLDIAQLGRDVTYTTLIERDKTFTVQASFTPYVNQRTYEANLAAGQKFYLLDTGLLRASRQTVGTESPVTIATVDWIDQTATDALYARAGTQHTYVLTVHNAGSGMSLLTGTGSIDGGTAQPFINVQSGQQAMMASLWSKVIAREELLSRQVDLQSDAGDLLLTASVLGVGPLFEATTNTDENLAIDFGQIATGQTTLETLLVTNADTIGLTLPAEFQQLATLSLLGLSVEDDANGFFSIGSNFSESALASTESAFAQIAFAPNVIGDFTATLVVQTDVNAALGQLGNVYRFTLTGSAVPEPSSTLLLLPALALLRRQRKI